MDPTIQIITVSSGSPVSFAIFGDPDGYPVLALHGAPACRLMFSVADAAARQHGLKLIAPDRPGYADTPPDRSPTLASRAVWLEEVTRALGLQRFGVLAISGGAPYAVALAARMPDRVTGLALVSPMGPVADYLAATEASSASVSFLHRRFFLHLGRRTWLTRPVGNLGAALFSAAPNVFSGWAPRLAGAQDAAILARPPVKAAMMAMTLEALRQGAAGGVRDLEVYAQPWQVPFDRITAPAEVWQGEADTVVPPAASYWLASRLPRCTLHRLPAAGHFWVFDHVDEVVRATRALVAA